MTTTINRFFRVRLFVSCVLLCIVVATYAQEEKGVVFPDDYPVLHPQFRKWPSPAMDDSVTSAGPVLCWPAVKKKGVSYDVRLSKDSSFGGGAAGMDGAAGVDGSAGFAGEETILKEGIPWTVYPVSRRLAAGRWYWQYRVHGGRWSAVERFRVTAGASTHIAPPAEQFLAGVPAAHPRVLIDPKEVREFAAAVRGGADAAALLKKAVKMLGVAIPEETAGASARKGRNEDESRKLALEASKVGSYKVYAAVDLFCKAWLISGDERYAAKAVSWGMAVAGWDPDGVSKINDFGDARCMLSMALVFDNFHDRLSAEQRMLLLKSIQVRADRFYREWINNIDAKVLSNHVWQYILHYFLQTAVAVYGEMDEAKDWLRYGYELWLARAPVLGGGDGGWQEGTSYFRINMETLLGIPLLIRDYTGYDFLEGNEWYRRNPYWMAYSFPAGSSSAGFGDDVEKHFSPGPDYLAYADALSRLTGSRMAAWYAGRIEKIEHLRLADADMLRWVRMRYLRGLTRPAPIAADSLPEAMVFPGTGVADMHSDMMDRDKDLMVSFRSSPYGSYGHLLADQNTFNILFGGQRLFYMSGHKVAMQDPHRLQWYKATKGHNGILIDGQGQPFNVEAYGYIKRFLNDKDISYVMGDASQAYSSRAEKVQTGLKKFYRHVLLLRPDILLVYDELEADHPAEWSWLIHSPGRIMMDTVGSTFHCSIKNASAGGALFSSQPVRWALSDTFGVPAENWVGRRDEDGNLIEYKNDSWHLTATTVGKAARMRWLAVMRVRPGAKAELLPLSTDASGQLTVGGWTIRAELDAARPAELYVSNGKRGVAFTTGGRQLSIDGKAAYKGYVPGTAGFLEERDGKDTFMKARDMMPAEVREIPVGKSPKHDEDVGREVSTQRDRRRPNILFAIADDQSFPYASAYGITGVRTPAFDRVAAAGVLFNNAFAAAPQCSPSRAAILTGRNIWQLEEAGTHSSLFPRKFTVFTDVLEKSGYTIGYTGKPWAPGNWKDAGWPRNPVGPEYNTKKLAPPATGISKTDYYGNFVDFYEHRKKDEPFFFWYGGNEPHRIYEEGSGKKAGMDLRQSFVPSFLPDDSVVRSDIADYDLEIGWFDSQLKKMIQFLKEKGELDNTLIVVTSDNGMPFPSAKANLTEYGSHVPLAICWPDRIAAGGVSNDLVSLIDLAPTFLNIAGVDTVAGMAGRGLQDVLFRPKGIVPAAPHRSYVLTGRERHSHSRPDDLGYPSRAIRTDSLLYILNFKPGLWPAGDPPPGGINAALATAGEGASTGLGGDFKPIGIGYGDIDDPSPTKVFMMKHKKEFPALFRDGYEKRPAEQLFDIRNDPACTRNLLDRKMKGADRNRYASLGRAMKDSLLRLLREQGDPRVTGHGDIFDSYPRFGLMRDWPGFKERGKYNPAYMNKKD